MKYEDVLVKFLSTCDGKILDVFYEIYSLINQMEQDEQSAAIMFLCENAFKIKSDGTNEIDKKYYTDEQAKKARQKVNEKFEPVLDLMIEEDAKKATPPIEFYSEVWEMIQSSMFKTKRERALALFSLVDHPLIPYRGVGVGISMSNDTYQQIYDKLEETILDETEYIIKLSYEQKTQRASLLLDKLLSLADKDEQTVYLSIIMNEVANDIKADYKAAIERI